MTDYAQAMADCLGIEGALGAALVDQSSGMTLATGGDPPAVDLHVAAAGNSSVVQAKLRTMEALGLDDEIEDILISLGKQYHLIRPLRSRPGVFFYLIIDRSRANLAMARMALAAIEEGVGAA